MRKPHPAGALSSALGAPSAPGRLASVLAPLLALLIGGCDRSQRPAGSASSRPAPPPTITTKSGLEMALIPAGEFLMGDNRGDNDEKPAHNVRVSAFYMDTHEITQKAYASLMQNNPAKSKAPDKPVEQVDWYHAVLYCNLRSLKEGLKPCYDANTLTCDFRADGYRLPTEAEWECACRAGTQTRYSFGDAPVKLNACAWFKDNASQTTHPAAQKLPNPWGLYDMHGNVAEWCHDIYGATYYQQNQTNDPSGPAAGDKRVLRGGSWRATDDACRSSARQSESPRFADACFGSDAYGFRCVRKAP
jgi:formylglycine-generating enzyme required for sulfatase activity